MNKNIGHKIRKLREAIPLSQAEMALEIGIGQGMLCKIENGKVKKIDFVIMYKIYNLFNVDLQYFLEDNFSKTKHDNKNSAVSTLDAQKVNDNDLKSMLMKVLDNQNQIMLLIESLNRLEN